MFFLFAKIREPAIIHTKGTDIVAQMLRIIHKVCFHSEIGMYLRKYEYVVLAIPEINEIFVSLMDR